MQDHFRDADMQEYRRMQRDLGSLAKTCRNLQLKLKRTQQLRQQQKERAKSEQAKALLGVEGAGAVVEHGSASAPPTPLVAKKIEGPEPEAEAEAESGGEMWKSAAIW